MSAMLEPIDDQNIGQAIRLLVEGFPDSSEEFWRSGIARARAIVFGDADWPLGFLLRHNGRFAGVLLTFASPSREGTPPREAVLNLSSWYVEPGARTVAPLMLMKVLERRAGLFTDLTPTEAVAELLRRLGFTQWSEGRLLVSWPQALLAGGERAVVRPLAEVPAGALDAATRGLLEDHERLGCVAAALHVGGAWRPLLFARRRIWGVPAGHLFYARSRREVIAHRRAVTAFLTRRGMPILCLDAGRAERAAGCVYVTRRFNRFFRGEMAKDRVDYAYSELVYFNLY